MSDGPAPDLPIRIISLKDSIERQNHVKTQLDSLNLKYSVFNAVDGDCLLPDEIKECYDGKNALSSRGKHLGPGEVGCALSHIRLYQEVVRGKLEAMLILEDDVEIDPEVCSFVKHLHNLPSNWDIVFLGCDSKRVFLASISSGKIFSSGFELTRPLGIGPVKGAYAYLVSHSGARKLLDSTAMFCKPIDSYTGDISVLSIYVFKPNMVFHPHSFPSITAQKLQELHQRQKSRVKTNRESGHWYKSNKFALYRLRPAYRKMKSSIKYRIAKLYLTVLDHFDPKARNPKHTCRRTSRRTDDQFR